jgi:hypothetical protein
MTVSKPRLTLLLVALIAVACLGACDDPPPADSPIGFQTMPQQQPGMSTAPPVAAPTAALSPSLATPAPTSVEQLCSAPMWPRPLPPVVGLDFDQAAKGALMCFDGIRAIAPDGHDVMNDKGSPRSWSITAISPTSGTPVGKSDQVTLQLAPEDVSAAPAFRPCDWVTTSEAARLLAVQSVSALPVGDQAGSVDQSCAYNSGNDLVTSELKLPGSFAVDARSEFSITVAAGKGSPVSGLPGPSYCGTSKAGNGKDTSMLSVLLNDHRIYQVMGGPSCDTLKQFAQTALFRMKSY